MRIAFTFHRILSNIEHVCFIVQMSLLRSYFLEIKWNEELRNNRINTQKDRKIFLPYLMIFIIGLFYEVFTLTHLVI